MDFPCDEGENRTECWKYEDGEPKNANEQYRTGLFYLFGSTIVGIIVTAIILSVGDEGIILFGAALFGLATIVLALGWIYATLSLLIAEIFAINILYILNLLIFIASIIGWLDDDPSFINTSGVGIDTNKKPRNRTKPHGKGKIDHEQIKRLVRQYSDNKVVLQNYIHNSLPEPKESSLMNAIRHRRSEYEIPKLVSIAFVICEISSDTIEEIFSASSEHPSSNVNSRAISASIFALIIALLSKLVNGERIT